jgi:hypothetical protein
MKDRPTIGAVGVTTSVLAPDGEADFNGALFPVRIQEGSVGSGSHVVVTGFDPWFLTVREATPAEVDAQLLSVAPGGASSEGKGIVWVIGFVVFGSLLVVGSLLFFQVGGLAAVGFLLAMAGQLWLLGLIVRECDRQALILALVIPFFAWYFALQRWDVAKWAFLLNALGLALILLEIAIAD